MLNEETLKIIANNDNFTDKKLLTDLTVMFHDRPEAMSFLELYGNYGEMIDDLVDQDKPVDIQKVDSLRLQLTQHPYWQKWNHCLFLVERLIHNTYFDSTKWEKSNAEWKRRDARCLSHCGYNMLFAVIIIEFGMDKLNEFSLRFREHAHLRHLNDPM